ncbi:hypothetical protein [Gordonia iterans]
MTEHPTITDLITARREETGWSYRTLAAAGGNLVSHQQLASLGTAGPREWPKTTDTIAGLAKALDVREDTIVLAFAAALGIKIPTQPSLLAVQLPATTDRLTAAERTHIVGLVRALTTDRPEPAN